jgi:hypothetical protein
MKKNFLLMTIFALSSKLLSQTTPAYTSLAVGTNAISGSNSFALGMNVQSATQASFGVGRDVKAGDYSIALGSQLNSYEGGIAIGTNSQARGQCITIGSNLSVQGFLSIAMGTNITTNGKRSAFAIGDENFLANNFGNDADNQMLMRFKNGYKFHLTNDKLAFSINPNGTVGIDQSNQNNGTINSGLIFGGGSGEGIASKRTGGGNQWELDFYSNFINRMSITNGGRVGIGTTSPQQMLSVAGSMNIDQNNANTYGLNPGLTFGSGSGEGISSNRVGGTNNNSYGLDFYAGGLVRMAINNSGNVGIGYFNPNTKLEVAGNIYATGTITPSDIRYKKDISLVKNALNKIMSISGYYYSFKTNEFPDMGLDTKKQIGVIAQEVEEVVPEVVVTRPDGYKTVDYPKLIPLLIQGMKEQQQQIEELKKLIAELIKNK